MKMTISILLTLGCAASALAQSLPVTGGVPAYIDISGLAPDDYRDMEHEFTVAVPTNSGTVQVRMGVSEGDTSILIRDFVLEEHHFGDSTWVAPNGSGHTIGLGRFTGLDAVFVQVRAGNAVVGTGSWERP